MRSLFLITLIFISMAALPVSTGHAQDGCAIDLMLALDGSGSIDPADFALMRDFVAQLTSSFVIGPQDVNVGIIQFSDTAELYLPLSERPDEVARAIANMTQFGDRTNIASAIQLAQGQFVIRRSIPRVIVVLTDGLHNMDGNPIAQADIARAQGTTIIGIAVGSFDLTEMTSIAGVPENVVTVAGFSGLTSILDSLLGKACSATVPTAAPPTAVPQAPVAAAPTEAAAPATAAPVFTGETRIAFASDRDGDFEIYAMDSNGGNVAQLTFNDDEDDRPAFSVDGQFIVWQSAARGGTFDIWVMNADGSNAHQLTDHGANEQGPVFSPDGTRIAFYSDRNQQNTAIFVMNADGSNVQQVSSTIEGALDLSPAWSADGQKLIYYSDKTEGRELYILDVNTRSEQRMTHNNVYDGEPDWQMNGSGIVFAATRSPQGNGEPEIYTSDATLPDADQQNATQLTDNIATDDDPAWSPDGREIVFMSGRDGNFDIWVMNANGGDQRPLTRTPSTEQSPAWGWKVAPPGTTAPLAPSTPIAPAQAGPRDTQIAFASDRDGDYDIYVMDGDGSNVRQATFNDAEDDKPAWSNDGRLIAWTSNQGGSFNLWVMNADGSDQRQITNTPANDWDPVWSPDGSQLAFFSDRDGDPEIWIVNADGGVAQQITNNSETVDRSPAWSPDGSKLLYYSDKTGGREIFLLDLASGSEIQLTSNNVYDGQPDWSLNGTQIVFAATRSPQGNGEPEIYISDASLLDANGSNATQLTDNPYLDDDPAWSPDGRQIVFESNRNGHLDIWIVNADGSGLLQLTRDPSNDRSPDWIWKP